MSESVLLQRTPRKWHLLRSPTGALTVSDPAAAFDVGYIEQLLARHFDEANGRILLKWREDDSAATDKHAQGDARHHVLLADSALTIGKEALSGAFLTFLSYSRDSASRPQDNLEVAGIACQAFIARVTAELEERFHRQVGLVVAAIAIVRQLRADLDAALDGYVQDAIRGRHGDQQIVEPSAMREPTNEHAVVNIAAGVATLPLTVARASATLDGAGTFSADGVVFPKQELIRMLQALSPDEVERVFKEVAESRRHGLGGKPSPGRRRRAGYRCGGGERCAAGRTRHRSAARLGHPFGDTRLCPRAALAGREGALAHRVGGRCRRGAGKKLGEDHAEEILTQLVDLESKLTAIVTPIAHIFASMHLPF
jgi:hypothetical protein